MNEKAPTQQQLMAYVLNLLDPAEQAAVDSQLHENAVLRQAVDRLRQFVISAEKERLHDHAATAHQREQTYDRLLAWVLGEADDVEKQQLQQAINSNAAYRHYHNDLMTLADHFAEADQFKPLARLREQWEQFTEGLSMQQPTMQPIFRGSYRSSEEHTSTVATLDFSDEGFHCVLTRSRLGQHWIVDGAIKGLQTDALSLASFDGGRVWLLLSGEKTMYEAVIDEDGEFAFHRVAAGVYQFELAWDNAFVEASYTIPDAPPS